MLQMAHGIKWHYFRHDTTYYHLTNAEKKIKVYINVYTCPVKIKKTVLHVSGIKSKRLNNT